MPTVTLHRVGLLSLICCLAVHSTALAATDADLLLQGGILYDGTGADGIVGDVAIRDGRIIAIGKLTPGKIARTIDCRGLAIAPGFIDVHTHTDQTFTRAATHACLNYLLQGCTTMGTGNCGGSRDVRKFLDEVDTQGMGPNIFHLVGHGSIRQLAMKSQRRQPTAEELQRMKDLIADAMHAGAWGMSTGLIYPPSSYADTEEIIALARVVAEHKGLYVSHIRNEAANLQDAIAEAIRIGRESGAPVHISHFKVMGKSNWGAIRSAAAAIEKARAEGLKITADQYPYTASSTSLASTLLPDSELKCSRSEIPKRIAADPAFAAKVRRVISARLSNSEQVVIATSKTFPAYVGKSLKQLAAAQNISEVDLVLAIAAVDNPSVVNHAMAEADVRFAMTLPWVATASDGAARVQDPAERQHPRNFGTFARKIGHYAIHENVLPLPLAIRSATGLPADIFSLPDRGYLRIGYIADIVVFEPASYRDQATFDSPQSFATGVRFVFLAGNPAVEQGRPTPTLLGRALRHHAN